MYKLILSIICVSLSVPMLACLGETTSYMIREEPAGIESSEAITITLLEYEICDEDDKPRCRVEALSETVENDFESCLSYKIHTIRPDLTIISANEFRQAVFPGIARDAKPRSVDTYMQLIKEPEFRRYSNLNKLHYLILLKVSTHKGPGRWSADDTTRQCCLSPIWGLRKWWNKDSKMYSIVLDAYKSEQSGIVASKSFGEAGYVIPIIIIIPFPPLPWFAMTETKACSELGNELVKFLQDTSTPKQWQLK